MITPSFQLNFSKIQFLPNILTFGRNSNGSCINKNNRLKYRLPSVGRFNFSTSTGECLGLLIEGTSTNLCINSEVIGVGAAVTITSDNEIAPDGSTTMDLVVENTANAEHYANDSNTTPNIGTTYCYSVYVKDGPSANRLLVHRVAGNNAAVVYFNPRTGALLSPSGINYVSSGVINCGDGIYRVWITYTATIAATTVHRIQLTPTASVTIYTGDGTSGLHAWGRQLEIGSYPSSYIPTTAAAATRTADTLNLNNPYFGSLIRQSEGTFIVGGNFIVDSINRYVLVVGTGTGTDYMCIRIQSGNIYFTGYVSNVQEWNINAGTYTAGANVTIAIAYKLNECYISVNGNTAVSDLSCTLPTLSQMEIGNMSGTGYINGNISRITYYSTSQSTNLQNISL